MNIGTSWIIIEESFHSDEKRLLSMISPRKNSKHIAEYMEQKYVDTFASIEEKISYKKNKKKSPFRINSYEIDGTTVTCGHDPIYRAYYCHELRLENGVLSYYYRVYKGEIGSREVTDCKGEVAVA